MDRIFGGIWVYLASSPLLWLTVTLGVYLAGQWLFQRSGGRALFNPVALAITLLVLLLLLTGTSYSTYFLARNSSIFCSVQRPWRWRYRFTSTGSECGGCFCRSSLAWYRVR